MSKSALMRDDDPSLRRHGLTAPAQRLPGAATRDSAFKEAARRPQQPHNQAMAVQQLFVWHPYPYQ